MDVVKNGCGQCGHGTLKLTVFREGEGGINWFFSCLCKFRKAKSYFSDFWVGVVKNGYGHLVHETLKSAVSYLSAVWVMNWADFLHAGCDAIIFRYTNILSISDFLMPVYCSCTCWTTGGSRKGPIKKDGSVFLSILPSVRVFFWNWIISFFFN